MKYKMLLASTLMMATMAASGQDTGQGTQRVNPFLKEYNTPYGVPPFDQLTLSD